MNQNRHPADRLQDIRHARRELEEEEAELRDYLLERPDDRLGDDYAAVVGLWPQSRLDVDALERELGPGRLAGFRVRNEVKVVRLQRRPGRNIITAAGNGERGKVECDG